MNKVQKWLMSRGINQETIDAFGLVIENDVLSFPYLRGSEAVYIKHRGPQKRFWASDGGTLRLYNLDRVLGSKNAVIVEGEMDALALHSAGIPIDRILSVPNGAPQEPGNLSRYKYILDAWQEGLSRELEVIIAVDNDKPGKALAKDLEMIFGPARCRIVTWPEDCKDANDVLVKHGPDVLYDTVTAAPPVHVDGLFRLSEIEEPEPMVTWEIGFPGIEGKIAMAPGTVSVVTGHPGHGKSAFFLQVMLNIAKIYGIKVALFSAEMPVKPQVRKQLRQYFWHRPENQLTDSEKAKADAFVDDHFVFLVPSAQEQTLNRIMDLFEVAAIRHGCRYLAVDPWNKLELDKPKDVSETDHIGKCLDGFITFARRYQVHVQIIAHPSKPNTPGRVEAPMLSDISGSKNWDNRVDQGFVVHRSRFYDDETKSRVTDCKLFMRKARFMELGFPCAINMTFDLNKQAYLCTDYPQAPIND